MFPFLRLCRELASNNSTTDSVKADSLTIQWYVVLIIVVGGIFAIAVAYQLCCARSTNKRKLHALIGEARALELS